MKEVSERDWQRARSSLIISKDKFQKVVQQKVSIFMLDLFKAGFHPHEIRDILQKMTTINENSIAKVESEMKLEAQNEE